MEQKKPNTKTILNDFIYMRFESKDNNLWCQKSDSCYLWLGSHGLVAAEESEAFQGASERSCFHGCVQFVKNSSS